MKWFPPDHLLGGFDYPDFNEFDPIACDNFMNALFDYWTSLEPECRNIDFAGFQKLQRIYILTRKAFSGLFCSIIPPQRYDTCPDNSTSVKFEFGFSAEKVFRLTGERLAAFKELVSECDYVNWRVTSKPDGYEYMLDFGVTDIYF